MTNVHTIKDIHGERMLQALVMRLIKASMWFLVTPLPEDQWEIAVKQEHGVIDEKWRTDFLEDKGLPSYDHLVDLIISGFNQIQSHGLENRLSKEVFAIRQQAEVAINKTRVIYG